MHDSKDRLKFNISTTSKLWSIQFNVKNSRWVHLMFAWRTQGLVLYENGQFSTKTEKSKEVRYPSFGNSYQTLTTGDPQAFMKLRSGGRFEIAHLVIWTRCLAADERRTKAFMTIVKQDLSSRQCCRKKFST